MSLAMILPFLVILNGVRIPIGTSSAGLDQIAGWLLLVPLGTSALLGVRRVQVDAAVWWLTAILGINVVASWVHSPTPGYSLLQCVNLASAWIIYLIVMNALVSRELLERFLRRVLWAAIAASVAGIGAFLLASAGVNVGGAEVSALAASRLTQAYGAYGFMVEPNIFGSFAAAHLVLGVALLAGESRLLVSSGTATLVRWSTALASVSLVLSFTRAAWLGAAAGVVCVAALSRSALTARIPWRRIAVSVAAVAGVAGALLILPGSAGELFRFKLLNLVNLQSQTGVLRILTYGLALEQTAAHPVLGWGTFTFAPLVAQGADFQQFENWRNLWIGNFVLLALHDTGVIGLSCWIGLLWSIIAGGVRAARRLASVDPVVAGRTVALTAAVVSLLIPFLATTGFSLGYPWLLIGLLGAHARLAREETAALPAVGDASE